MNTSPPSNKENIFHVSDEPSNLSHSSTLVMGQTVECFCEDMENQELLALAERISFPTIWKLLDEENSDEKKRILLNTFIRISQKISSNSKRLYHKRVKDDQDELKTYAFGISSEGIYISREYLAKGTFKWINLASRIGNFANQDFSKQVELLVRIKPNPQLILRYTVGQVNGELLKESKNMKILEDNPHAAVPSLFFDCSKTQKAIFFQKKYSGDGTTLVNALFKHQLRAIKELGLALTLMHQKGYVHMDVKPDNLFILGDVGDEEGVIEGKIGDIGLMREIGTNKLKGTPVYLPPEVVKFVNTIQPDGKKVQVAVIQDEQTAHTKIDSYGLGLTILEIILSQAIKQQIYTDNFECKAEDRLSFSSNSKYCPLFTQIENQYEFDKQVNNFLKLARQALLKVSDPDMENKIKMLDICKELLKFNVNDRMTCETATALLASIEAG